MVADLIATVTAVPRAALVATSVTARAAEYVIPVCFSAKANLTCLILEVNDLSPRLPTSNTTFFFKVDDGYGDDLMKSELLTSKTKWIIVSRE